MVIWIYGYIVISLYGYMDIWLYSLLFYCWPDPFPIRIKKYMNRYSYDKSQNVKLCKNFNKIHKNIKARYSVF